MIMKKLEGKTVYLRPTGNNARYHSDKILTAKIIKVARVFVTFVFDGYRNEEKYRFDGNELHNDHNGGYVVYKSMKDVEDYYAKVDLSSKISDKFRYQRDYEKIDILSLRKVAELLGVTE